MAEERPGNSVAAAYNTGRKLTMAEKAGHISGKGEKHSGDLKNHSKRMAGIYLNQMGANKGSLMLTENCAFSCKLKCFGGS